MDAFVPALRAFQNSDSRLREACHRHGQVLREPIDLEVRRLAAAAGYETGCAVTVGLSTDDDDPLMLHRVRILGTDRFADFVCRLRTGRAVADATRRGLRRILGRAPSS